MKNLLIAFAVIFSLCSLASAEDIRKNVQTGEATQSITSEIDPDEHIFGIKYGVTENEFIDKFGKPDGYIRLNAVTTAMIYGKSIAFIFKSGKLDGIRIASHSILDWKLSREMLSNSLFSKVKWKLTNGIKESATRSKVKEILGDSLTNDNYEWQYETDVAVVTFNFSHWSDEGESESSYKVTGIMIRKK